MGRQLAGRWFGRIDLRWRLLIALALFAIPILGVQAWNAADERNRVIEDARQQARSIALVADANYSQVILAGEAAISTLVESPSVQAGSGAECDAVLRRSEEHTSELQTLMRSSY